MASNRYVQSYQSFSLDRGDSIVTTAIVIVHGTDRNADDYFQTLVDATTQAGYRDSTIIISPRFQTSEDLPRIDEPYWSSSGWKQGDLSSASGPLPRTSSFAVIDMILTRLDDHTRFPQLTRIVVAGHSAGGQVVHRFAAASLFAPSAQHRIRYITANPSTYLYVNPLRESRTGFAVPSADENCTDYDDWLYGLQDRNSYASIPSAETLRNNLLSRDVVVMVGTADTLTNDLDMTCGANLQGRRRFDRGLTIVAYLNAQFPTHRHRLVQVPSIGHSSRGIYTSVNGISALFQW